jgi:hypothetical protein
MTEDELRQRVAEMILEDTDDLLQLAAEIIAAVRQSDAEAGARRDALVEEALEVLLEEAMRARGT